jgi:hypothetical protein
MATESGRDAEPARTVFFAPAAAAAAAVPPSPVGGVVDGGAGPPPPLTGASIPMVSTPQRDGGHYHTLHPVRPPAAVDAAGYGGVAGGVLPPQYSSMHAAWMETSATQAQDDAAARAFGRPPAGWEHSRPPPPHPPPGAAGEGGVRGGWGGETAAVDALYHSKVAETLQQVRLRVCVQCSACSACVHCAPQ